MVRASRLYGYGYVGLILALHLIDDGLTWVQIPAGPPIEHLVKRGL